MKGITPVIAIILLLLITVSMAGFAFVFLQRTLEQTTESTEQGLQTQLNQQGQKYAIDNKDDASNIIYVRHTGTTVGDTSTVSVYVNNQLVGNCWGLGAGAWSPSTIKACSTPFVCYGKGNTTIRVSGPGGTDSSSC